MNLNNMILKPVGCMFALMTMAITPAFAQNVVTVNGQPISKERIDLMVKQALAQGEKTDPSKLREAITRDLIAREVLIQEAEHRGFSTRDEVKAMLENAEKKIIKGMLADFVKKNPAIEVDEQGIGARTETKAAIQNVRQSIIINAMLGDFVKNNPVEESEIKSEYNRYKAAKGDTEYRTRHILVATEGEAKVLIDSIKSGRKFEDLAKANSKDSSASIGGDLGWSSPVNYVNEFSQAMVALQKGAVSEVPVKSKFGYHIIKLEDTRDSKNPSLDEVKQDLIESLQIRKLRIFRVELMKKARIQ